MMPSFRSLVPIVAFAVIYAAISLTITNSYYQLMMTLVLVWAVTRALTLPVPLSVCQA